MPHGITQCYLPPGRGDIPALGVTIVRWLPSFDDVSQFPLYSSFVKNPLV